LTYTILKEILDNLEGVINKEYFSLKKVNNVFLQILEKEQDKYDDFKENIKSKWDLFTAKNQNRIIKKTYTTFFYENFHEFFKFFLKNFFRFNESSLDNVIVKEKISDKIIFFEYDYNLTLEEKEHFDILSNNFKEGILFGFPLLAGYLYFVVRLLGMIIRKIIQKKIFILLDAVIVKNDSNNLQFLIIIKESKDDIFSSYYKMVLYYFLRSFKSIPEEYFENLLQGREKLYQIALEEYNSAKEKLVDLLYYFYKKCNLLNSFSPLLDFFNFVCSRVEDSIFSKIEIIKKEFLVNLDYSDDKKNSIIKFFDFLDRKSTLYSTFQANNLPSPKSQLNLFLLYMKYYFGSGLEALEVGNLLFLPKLFKRTLDQYNKEKNGVIGANSINNINRFLNYFTIISDIESINLFFYSLFKKNISHLNFGFFKSFLKSLDSNFSMVLNQENENLSDNPENSPFTFEIIVDHICRILYVLIDKIFLRSNPDDASNNFIDPRSRYIGKNIALRVLELFVFQDINYSDDVWPDYIISLNRDQLKNHLEQFKIKIPDKNFYTVEEITQIMVTYNIHSFLDQPFFEEWLIYEIILPLNDFILKIRNSVTDYSNEIEVSEKLAEIFLEGVDDKESIRELKYLFQQLAPFWKYVE